MKFLFLVPIIFWGTGLFSQETPLNLSVIQMMMLGEEEVQRRNEALILGQGQWSSVDRLLGTPRFNAAMEYIVLNEKTTLLADLTEISAFYGYLLRHQAIRRSGLQWTRAARVLTYAVLPLWEAQSSGTAGLAGLIAVIGSASDPDNRHTYEELMAMYNEGFSPAGNAFLDGSASKKVLADVTHKYFRPIILGEINISDPFEIDALILQQEQYVTLEPYYSQFTEVDKAFIINGLVKASVDYIEEQGQTGNIDLMKPRGRFKLGMVLMGYDVDKIEQWLRGRGL